MEVKVVEGLVPVSAEQAQAFAMLLAMLARLPPAAVFYAILLLAHRAAWPWLTDFGYAGLILSALAFH